MSEPGAFAPAGPEEQAGGEPPLAGAGVVVCLIDLTASGWARVGVLIVGSSIAAIGIMTIGLAWRPV